jgi:uncharacterized protein
MDGQPPLFTARATVATAKPGRYLQQLCKHFEHRIPTVTYDPSTGRIPFPKGPCDLAADPLAETLTLRVSAASADDLASLEDVVARHLVRFMFREDIDIAWTRSAA